MVKEKDILGRNSLDDTAWLCSLSESEIDLLMSLKKLVYQRAKIIGHEELADKFDLKTLRVLVVRMIQYFQEKVKDLSHTSGSGLADPFQLDSCNLLKINVENSTSIEELEALMGNVSRTKRQRDEGDEDERRPAILSKLKSRKIT